jgi:hypothetical protein
VATYIRLVSILRRSKNNPFILEAWIVSEVHQQSEFHLGCMEIIQQLSAVLIGER